MANENQNRPIRVYNKQFAHLLGTVFSAKAAFSGAFGALQTVDAISNKDTMFSLKTNNMPVVVGKYDTGKDVAFGDGTANSSRFGKMQEVTYLDTDVPYADTWALHEGFDRFTVNNDLTSAVADRLALQAEAKVRLFNAANGSFLVKNAAKDLGAVDKLDDVFIAADTYYTDLEIDVAVKAYVTPAVYNAIIMLASTTVAKNSAVNIDTNGVTEFHGFQLIKTATKNMAGAQVIFSPDGIAADFVGIETARTIEAQQFDGMELQGAGKYGQFVSDDNKKAILTAGVVAPTEPEEGTTDPEA